MGYSDRSALANAVSCQFPMDICVPFRRIKPARSHTQLITRFVRLPRLAMTVMRRRHSRIEISSSPHSLRGTNLIPVMGPDLACLGKRKFRCLAQDSGPQLQVGNSGRPYASTTARTACAPQLGTMWLDMSTLSQDRACPNCVKSDYCSEHATLESCQHNSWVPGPVLAAINAVA